MESTETKTMTQAVAIRSHKTLYSTLLMWLVLAPLTIMTLMPLVYMVSQAFTPEQDAMAWPIHWIPAHPTVTNFTRIFGDPTLPVLRWFTNSMFVSISITVLVLFLSSMAAYAYARLEFPGRDKIFFLLLFSLMVPAAVTLIPAFLLLRDLKMLDTYHAIIWPACAAVGGISCCDSIFSLSPKN